MARNNSNRHASLSTNGHCSQWPGVTPYTGTNGYGSQWAWTDSYIYKATTNWKTVEATLLDAPSTLCFCRVLLSCSSSCQPIYIYTVYIHVLRARSITKYTCFNILICQEQLRHTVRRLKRYTIRKVGCMWSRAGTTLHSASKCMAGPRIVLRSSHGGAPAGTKITKVSFLSGTGSNSHWQRRGMKQKNQINVNMSEHV